MENLKMGWIPDYPDINHYDKNTTTISARLKKAGQTKSIKQMLDSINKTSLEPSSLPPSVDLRQWFSPVEDQGQLGSCTAHAGIGLLEYFEKKTFGKYIDMSRLFLYKVTRNLMHLTGDTGASLSKTMEALVMFGSPPEEYSPYVIGNFDREPTSFCYSMAQNYQSLGYYHLDTKDVKGISLLNAVKVQLNAGLACMFGFTVYSTIKLCGKTGKIFFPVGKEKILGGHAVIAAGYDDNITINNSKGAILIRNSWGTSWGESGYGWIPYDYIIKGLAKDWWSILRNEWVDTGVFN